MEGDWWEGGGGGANHGDLLRGWGSFVTGDEVG